MLQILNEMIWLAMEVYLGAVHKCQHFQECTNHTLSGGGGLWTSIFFPYNFNFIGLIFIISIGIFGTQNMLMCALFFGGGEGRRSQKVYGLYTMNMLTYTDGPLQFVLKCKTDLGSGNIQTCNIIKELCWKTSVRTGVCVKTVSISDPFTLSLQERRPKFRVVMMSKIVHFLVAIPNNPLTTTGTRCYQTPPKPEFLGAECQYQVFAELILLLDNLCMEQCVGWYCWSGKHWLVQGTPGEICHASTHVG